MNVRILLKDRLNHLKFRLRLKSIVIVWVGASYVALCAAATLPLSAQEVAILARGNSSVEAETQTLIWRGDALTILLPMNAEKRLIFPDAIQVDLQGNLTTQQLQIVNNDHNLYLIAKTSFPKTRIYVTLKASASVILLDLVPSPEGNTQTQSIKLPRTDSGTLTSTTHSISNPQNNLETPHNSPIYSADAFVEAIQFAWQALYAPKRLADAATADSVWIRTPMRTSYWVTGLIYGDSVLAHPLASWQKNGLYVTAIELRNPYPNPLTLDLAHNLCGRWQAAAFYPRHRLKPAGDSSGDSTTLFLLSTQAFGTVLEDCHAAS